MNKLSLTGLAALTALAALATTAIADPDPDGTQPEPVPSQAQLTVPAQPPAQAPTQVMIVNGTPTKTTATTQPQQVTDASPQDDGWHRPVGRRFMHGFRLGWTYLMNYEKPTRDGGMSIKDEFKLKTPNMMLLGYEGFYRMIGHSWLNVLLVGNVSVAGLEQSKFIPAASGLIGFELDQSFQIGVGVNLTPDAQSPSHMIVAAGWTPAIGSITTPVHFFFVPDTEGNHRMGATVGVTW